MFLDLRTKEKEIVGSLYNILETNGFAARVLPIEKIKASFPVMPSKVFGRARSVLFVSAADGYNEVEFDWVRRSKRIILPPALQAYRQTEKRIKEILIKSFGMNGYNFVRAHLPLKLLSSYCNFLHYGSNEVAYTRYNKGTVRLFAYYTDLPYERETEDIYRILEELCSVSQASGSISPRVSKFTVNETRLLLESTPLNKFPGSTRQKFISSDLVYSYDRLPKLLWKLLKVKPADFWKIDDFVKKSKKLKQAAKPGRPA